MLRRLAVAAGFVLLCAGQQVSALGLGEIQVQSKLNQRFSAVVPFVSLTQDEAVSVRAGIADNEAFARAGIDRPAYLSTIEVTVEATGEQPRILLASQSLAREPLLVILLEVRTAGGPRVYREFTVLLDPPPSLMPATTQTPGIDDDAPLATPAPGIEAADSSGAQALPAQAPEGPQAAPETGAPEPAPAAAVPEAAPELAPAAEGGAGSGDEPRRYGPVRTGDAMWKIANAVRLPDVGINQTLLGLYQANPGAFVDGNINQLLTGVELTVPAGAELRKVSESDAALQVRELTAAPAVWPGEEVPDDDDPASPVGTTADSEPVAQADTADTAAAVGAAGVDTATLDDPAAVDGTGIGTGSETPADDPGLALDEPVADPDPVVETAPQTDPATSPAAAPTAADTAASLGLGTQAPPAADGTAMPGASDAADSATAAAEDPGLATPADDAAMYDEDETETAAAATPVAEPATTGRGPVASNWLWLALAGLLVVLLLFAALRARRNRRAQEEFAEARAEVESAARDLRAAARPVRAATPPSPPADDDDDATRLLPSRPAPPPPGDDPDATRLVIPAAAVAAGTAGAAAAAARHDDDRDDDQTVMQDLSQTAQVPTYAAGSAEAAAQAFEAGTTKVDLGDNDPLAEADFHVAYGLYEEAALLLQQAAAREPGRTDLRAKLAETYFAAGQPDKFLQTARGLRDGLDGEAWGKIAIMGRQLCPGEALFAGTDSGGGTDLDLDLALDGPSDVPVTTVDEGLEFRLEELELPTQAQPEAPKRADDNALEFDLGEFDLGGAEVQPPKVDLPTQVHLDDFDLAGPGAPGSDRGTDELELSLDDIESQGLDEQSDDPFDEADLDGGNDAGTKLDLARAYVEMGDKEMARSLLDEVAAGGNDQQKAEAEALRARLTG